MNGSHVASIDDDSFTVSLFMGVLLKPSYFFVPNVCEPI